MMTEGSRQEGSRERALVRMSREQTAAPIELPRCTCTPCCALPVGVSDSDALCDAMEVDLRRQASHRVHYVLQTLADFHATATAMHQKRDTDAQAERHISASRTAQKQCEARNNCYSAFISKCGLGRRSEQSPSLARSTESRAIRIELVLLHAGRSERMQKETTSGPRTSKPYLVVDTPASSSRRHLSDELICTHRKLGFWCSACATCQRPGS